MCFLAGSASAQNVCSALLQGGTFDTAFTSRDTFAADFARSKLCQSGSNQSDTGFNLGIPIEGVPIEIGFNSSGSSNSNICNEKEVSAEAWQKFMDWSRRASPVIAKAFVECTKNEGIQVWAERSATANTFSLNASVRYLNTQVPPVRMEFSFTPIGIVRNCAPRTSSQLKGGVLVGNLTTFRVNCELSSYSKGVEIGLVANAQIPYGNMSVRPYLPRPLIALSTSTASRNGVETPASHDATFGWGADTLLDEWEGGSIISVSGPRWASWRFDQIIPGRYDVYITYAAEVARPLKLRIDGNLLLDGVANTATGSWASSTRKQFHAGRVQIDRTSADIRLEAASSGQSWPHVKELRLVFVGD